MTELVAGRYALREVVGAGGQGRVMRAQDTRHGRQVAIKERLVPEGRRDELLSEAKVLFSMRPHPGIALLRDDVVEQDRYLLIMDWIDGVPASSLLTVDGAPGLPFEKAVAWLEQIASALDHLHSHDPPILHGDVKPANIVVTGDGTAVLVDFGIAQGVSPYAGTASYRAPEGPLGPASDIFSLAVTALELLTGGLPVPGVAPDLSGVPEGVRGPVMQALSSGLSLDPAARPPTAGDLIAALAWTDASHNLSEPVTTFVGREREVSEVGRLLRSTRLLTLTGAGGCGKTRLATEAARRLLPRYPDGVVMVELASVDDGRFLTSALAAAAGAAPDEVVQSLAGERLLVLDNCEHVVATAASTVEELLGSLPDLRVLATSREPLRADGETVLNVAPLAVPPEGTDSEILVGSAAVALLLDRAAASGSAETLDVATAARVCRALDGIPLALELAAAGLRTLTAAELEAGLADRFSTLTHGRRSVPRHETLEAAIRWSYDLLQPEEQSILRRLSVFAGGWPAEAVDVVCGPGAAEIAEKLATRSLVVNEGDRRRLLETVRAFAAAELNSDERRRTRDAHARWMTGQRGKDLVVGTGDWLAFMEADIDNRRAALDRSIQRGDGATAISLAGQAWEYWEARGLFEEGTSWLRSALELDGGSDEARAQASLGIASLLQSQNELQEAHRWLEAALALDISGLNAGILNGLGINSAMLGDLDSSIGYFGRALEIQRKNSPERVPAVLGNLANALMFKGELDQAAEALREAAEHPSLLPQDRSVVLSNLGRLTRDLGDPQAAREIHVESLRLSRELGNKPHMAFALLNLTVCIVDRHQDLVLVASAGVKEAGSTLEGREEEMSEVQDALDIARHALGDRRYDATWTLGHELPFEDVVDAVISDSLDDIGPPESAPVNSQVSVRGADLPPSES